MFHWVDKFFKISRISLFQRVSFEGTLRFSYGLESAPKALDGFGTRTLSCAHLPAGAFPRALGPGLESCREENSQRRPGKLFRACCEKPTRRVKILSTNAGVVCMYR